MKHCQTGTTEDTAGPQRATKEHRVKRDLEKEMWTAGCEYSSWRKMEVAAQDRVVVVVVVVRVGFNVPPNTL